MEECFCFISLPLIGKEYLGYIHPILKVNTFLSALCIYFPSLKNAEPLKIYQPLEDFFYNGDLSFYEQGLENGDWLIIF